MKKGFTLTELLVVIALISILALLAVPNIIKIYNDSINKAMEVQENEILDAANLYINDYCTHRINSSYICPATYVNYKIICLNELTTKGYIENITFKGSSCKSMTEFDSNGKNGKTYLYCGESPNYTYITDSDKPLNNNCN